MNVKGVSDVLILSPESGARISVHVLSITKQALCFHLSITESNSQRAYDASLETSHDTENQSSPSRRLNDTSERDQNRAQLC